MLLKLGPISRFLMENTRYPQQRCNQTSIHDVDYFYFPPQQMESSTGVALFFEDTN
jgi:hypothetical protein